MRLYVPAPLCPCALMSSPLCRVSSVVPFPGMKPSCASLKSTNARILYSNTLSIIFKPCFSNFTPLYEPQFITSSFPLKIGTTTLVFHSSGIFFKRLYFEVKFFKLLGKWGLSPFTLVAPQTATSKS